MKKIPVIVLFGPTACGKTALVKHLFSTDASSVFSSLAEIISADSMQVYKGMDIATAKPDSDFLKKIPHHLLNLCLPNQQFSAFSFVEAADKACEKIYYSKKIPVVAGGTSFYIKNFVYGMPFTPESDEVLRKKLQNELKEKGALFMFERLKEVDFATAQKIHINDEYRILRALEVFEQTGKPLSSFSVPQKMREKFDFLLLAIERPRDELYMRINQRVVEMVNEGLQKEFLSLIEMGYTRDDPGMQAIGYREFFMIADKMKCSVKDVDMNYVTQLIQHDSRKYAKKQFLFFKSDKNVNWFSAEDVEGITAKIRDFLIAKNFEL